MSVIIKVENLGKKYIINHEKKEPYSAIRDVITSKLKSIASDSINIFKNKQNIKNQNFKEEFWALDDVNFEINQGDSVGIIGRNGAGKSTLLKVLSRITDPSKGRIEIKGRISSLLEVGTGFHPELTGKENIYLNGAILGLTRAEITKKFDEIVDFTGVEKFLDTPVKRYSSGMYVRLAFGVAAHLESEILVVDEVLAVGDAEFQKKCLNKLNSISTNDGRTVLFVSHNIAAIKKLCNRGILLENGKVKTTGEIEEVVNKYNLISSINKSFKQIEVRELGLFITNILINKNTNGLVFPFETVEVEIEINASMAINNVGLQLMISNENISGRTFLTNTKTTNNLDIKIKEGINKFTCQISKFNLASGIYSLGIGIDTPFVTFHYQDFDLFSFEVPEVIVEPRQISTSSAYGQVYLDHKWII
jgi:lipopolysaccharide transport system ATP-binding protein